MLLRQGHLRRPPRGPGDVAPPGAQHYGFPRALCRQRRDDAPGRRERPMRFRDARGRLQGASRAAARLPALPPRAGRSTGRARSASPFSRSRKAARRSSGRTGPSADFLESQGVAPYFEWSDRYGRVYHRMMALLERLGIEGKIEVEADGGDAAEGGGEAMGAGTEGTGIPPDPASTGAYLRLAGYRCVARRILRREGARDPGGDRGLDRPPPQGNRRVAGRTGGDEQ